MFETGIKVLDLLMPLAQGGKAAMFGGAGVGKTVLVMELIHAMVGAVPGHFGLCGYRRAVARRPRTADRHARLRRARAHRPVFGQMNEPPGARWRVGLTALTMAEYFRDHEHRNVLLLMDNVFRFVQAGSEVSGLLGRSPSRVGYQPTLATEVAALQERIASVAGAAITAIEAVYVPADDFTDPAVTAISSHLDSVIVLSRAMAAEGMYPAVDPLASSSILLDPLVVGARALRSGGRGCARPLRTIASCRTSSRCSASRSSGAQDRLQVARARRLLRFLTQPFTVTEAFTGSAGRSVKLTDTLEGCRTILDGATDEWAEVRSTWSARSRKLAKRSAAGNAPTDHEAADFRSDEGGCRPADVVSVRAEDESGSFGILQGHADLLTVLTPSVVAWRHADGRLGWCAVRRGVLTVRGGNEIAIATRQAQLGEDLDELEHAVIARFRAEADAERIARVAATRLHLQAIRRIVRALRPGRQPEVAP